MRATLCVLAATIAIALHAPAVTRADDETSNPDPDREDVILAPEDDAERPTPIYRADECIGAVVNGVCHGSAIDADPGREKCYGTWLNGRCIGPRF